MVIDPPGVGDSDEAFQRFFEEMKHLPKTDPSVREAIRVARESQALHHRLQATRAARRKASAAA